MTVRWMIPVLLSLAGAAAAQEVPSGWRVVKDKPGRCQLAVPPDWKPDELVIGFAISADKKTTVAVHSQQPGRDYHEVVDSAKKLFQGSKVVEESSSRTLFTYPHTNAKPGEGLYIATAGSTVCTATVDYDDVSSAPFARKIAGTVSPVK